MLRLLIQVYKVKIHIKEDVRVQILIKKDQSYFIDHVKSTLQNTEAIFNSYIELLIDPREQIFEIQVMLLLGDMRKLAGQCQINLRDWSQNVSNLTESILQKSPDPKAHIEFSFIFMSTNIPMLNKGLMSIEEYHQRQSAENMKKIKEENSDLLTENTRLNKQVEQLRRANKGLTLDKHQLQLKYQENEERFEDELRRQEQQVEDSKKSMTRMGQKMEQMMKIVDNYGQSELSKKVQDCYDRVG